MDRTLMGEICSCGDPFCHGCDDPEFADLFDSDIDETYDWLNRTGRLDKNGRPTRNGKYS